MHDDNFLSFPILLSLIILISLILKRLRSCSTTSNLPPGPWKLPVIGSLHHLKGGLPHHRLRDLSQKYGPLMHLQLGETSVVVVSSPEIAKEMLKTHETTFADRPRLLAADIIAYGSTSISLSPYGDYWRQLRKIATMELMSPKRVRSFQPIREEEVSNFVRFVSMNTGSPINLTDRLFSMTYAFTARAACGEKCKEQEAYIASMKAIVGTTQTVGVTNLFPSQKWLHVIIGVIPKLKELHRRSDEILENFGGC